MKAQSAALPQTPAPDSVEPPVIPPVLVTPLCCPVCGSELIAPERDALECDPCALTWLADRLHEPGQRTYPDEPLCGENGCIRPADHLAGECATIKTQGAIAAAVREAGLS